MVTTAPPTSRLTWIEQNLMIINKQANLVNLYPNIGQLMLHNTIELQRSRGLPVRILILKPRQVGWSTWTQAEIFHDLNRFPNKRALVVSADGDSTEAVFEMTQRFQENMPSDLRRPAKRSNRKELVYSKPHNSSIRMQTAGKDKLGMSTTVQYLHCSEFAYWDNAESQYSKLAQMVPLQPDTMIILETTADGEGGLFYDMFWEAVKRQKRNKELGIEDYTGYIPMFFPWYRFPEYKAQVPDARVIVLQTDKDDRYGDEKGEIEKYGLDMGQIMYRRLRIDELKGDIGQFNEKYPANALEAFQSSGRPVFRPAIVRRQEQQCNTGRRFLYDEHGDRFEVEQHLDSWHILHEPQPDHQYCMGADTMEGKLTDLNDSKSKADYHGVTIYDRTTNQFVAIYRGTCEQKTLGEQIYWAGVEYNNAWIAPEIPNGQVVLQYLKDKSYPNLYQRKKGAEKADEEDSDFLGWKTTTVTRPYLVNIFIGMMRDGDVGIGFKEIIEEMKTFIYDKNGKPIHMASRHDDLLFAAMIAIIVHLEMPLNPVPYAYDNTASVDYDIGNEKMLCRAGVFDTWKPGDEEDIDELYTE